MDGDGDLDAVFTDPRGGPDELWRNDGSGSLSLHQSIRAPEWTSAVALGDMDGDGDLDAVFADPGGGPNEVWRNNGSGLLSLGDDFCGLRHTGSFESFHVVPADENENGLLIGAFNGSSSTSPPPDSKYVLDARWVKGADAGPGREDIDELIQQYGPILYFHPDEEYFLDDAEWVLDHGVKLEWALVENDCSDCYDSFEVTHRDDHDTSSATLMEDVDYVNNEIKPNPPYSDSESFKLWLNIPNALVPGDLDRAKAYVRVLPWNTLFTEIQFWLFYPFNGPGRVEVCLSGSECKDIDLHESGRHYGDWEHVTLGFFSPSRELVYVFMSAHEGGHWFLGSDVSTSLQFEGDHPVVYSAKYSHAHYATEGRHEYDRIREVDYGVGTFSLDLYDLTGTGSQFRTFSSDSYSVISSDVYPLPEPGWLRFKGNWGQYEKLLALIGIPSIPLYPYKTVGTGPSALAWRNIWRLSAAANFFGWPGSPFPGWNLVHLPLVLK
jgi:hypothetical protein